MNPFGMGMVTLKLYFHGNPLNVCVMCGNKHKARECAYITGEVGYLQLRKTKPGISWCDLFYYCLVVCYSY